MTKILIVEDELIIQKALKMQLESEGYEVMTADNGKQALESINKVKPDMILMDLVMPELDGFEAIAEIQSQDELKDIPIVILSNLSQEEDIKKAEKLGINEFFIKADNDLSTITERIKDLL